MAALTRKQRASIEYALRNAERAYAYVMRDDVAIARRSARASTVLDYSRAAISEESASVLGVKPDNGSALTVVTKEIGSDLCGLAESIAELRRILAPAVTEAA